LRSNASQLPALRSTAIALRNALLVAIQYTPTDIIGETLGFL